MPKTLLWWRGEAKAFRCTHCQSGVVLITPQGRRYTIRDIHDNRIER